MLGEGGESKYETNINFLLEEYGVMFNNGNFLGVTLLSHMYLFISITNFLRFSLHLEMGNT